MPFAPPPAPRRPQAQPLEAPCSDQRWAAPGFLQYSRAAARARLMAAPCRLPRTLHARLLGAGAPARFRVAVYAVDWDSRGRRGTFALLDGVTFDPLAPIVQARDYERGVWLVWELSGPFRVRVSQTRGDNAVVNALLFDASA